MARELERAVVALVLDILGAELVPMPGWLIRPGKVECGGQWPLVQEIYADLTGGMVLPDVMRPVERRDVDATLQQPGEPPRILEVDEKQHFNHYRARTFDVYADGVPLAFRFRCGGLACGLYRDPPLNFDQDEPGRACRPSHPAFTTSC